MQLHAAQEEWFQQADEDQQLGLIGFMYSLEPDTSSLGRVVPSLTGP